MVKTLAMKKEYGKEDVHVVRENVVIITVKPGENVNVGNMGTIFNYEEMVTSKNMELLVSGTNIAAFHFVFAGPFNLREKLILITIYRL